MRVLLSTQPGEGHLYPMVPLARALQEAGHELRIASSASFAPRIEAQGFRAAPAGLDYLEADITRSFPETRRMRGPELGDWFLSELFADQAAHAMVPDLLRLAEDWKPELLLRNDYEFGSCVVAERLGLPLASVGCAFLAPAHHFAQRVEQPLAFLRSAFGLAPWPALDMLHPRLTLSQAPLHWHPVRLPVAKAFRPRPVTVQGADPLADWAGYDPDKPLVYASLGTVNNRRWGVLRTLLSALGPQPINLVLTVGRHADPASFGPQPDNVWVQRFIPQDLLLPRCDLFLTNASFFTVLASVLHGVPLVFCPLVGDEALGARRFQDLGFGRILRQPGPPDPVLGTGVPVFGEQTLRGTVAAALGDSSLRDRVAQGQRELQALPGVAEAVGCLEELVLKDCGRG